MDLRDNTTCNVFNDFRSMVVMAVMVVLIMIMMVTMMIMIMTTRMMIMITMIIITTMIIFSANQLPSFTSSQRPLLRELSLKISLTALLSERARTGEQHVKDGSSEWDGMDNGVDNELC